VKYAALFFDLDGTLIDSIDLWGMAIREMFASIDIHFTQDEFRRTYTPSGHLSVWLQKYDVNPILKEGLRIVRDTCYIRLLKEKVSWLPKAKEGLQAVTGTAPVGMVTGSWRKYVEAVDGKLDLARYFDTIVTEDDMGGFSKPHPHGLLIAADRLGVDPKKCMYIGDMAADVETAHSAGMPCVIVPSAYTAKEAKTSADVVLEHLGQLSQFLQKGV
jgi:HAD superfamily hydrolase (TIGR01509 family)